MTEIPPPALPREYDPPEDEKVLYRHIRDGQRGWKVRREGKDCIKLDRAMQEIILPFRESEWQPERESRPFNEYQMAQVAFEADKALCLALGQHLDARREWLNQTDEKRIAWIQKGPTGDKRKALYNAIMKVTKPWTVT